jgi:ATP-dependent helicase/DNAse subunit B
MKLIRGAPGSGKTRQVFREFKEALRTEEGNLRLVVPTATLVRHFQHELARDGVVFSPRSVISLNRLLLERAGETQLIPDGLLRALVRDSLQRIPFPEFAAVANTDGMADTVSETISLFENAGCTPDKLASIRKLGTHARPFEKLWRAVRDAARQRGFALRGDWIRAAATNAQPARIWFDGFLNFSPVEQEFLAALANTSDVTLAITDQSAAEDIYRLALKLGAHDRLLPGTPRRPHTTIVSAPTIEREADDIARRILELHQQGAEFREIGVALRDAATYVPLLQGTFARFGIPARFYFSSPLRKHPAAAFLSGLISAAFTGWDFETTLNSLRANPRWGLRADFDRFDFAVREAMPGNGATGLLNLCQSDWLREEIAACLKIESWVRTPQKPAEWVRRLESFAANLFRPGMIDVAPDHTGVEASRSLVAGVRSWLGAIHSVAPFWPDSGQPVPLADFWSVASIAVEAAMLQQTDERANVVHVMDAWEARQWDVTSLFVCGMSDRDFPRRRAEHLLFPDTDIDLLRKAGIPLRRVSDYEHEEQWLFDSLRTRAAESLILTYSDHDAAGKSAQRSRFIEFDRQAEAAQLCRPVARVAAPVLAAPGRIPAPALQAELARLHQSLSLTSLEDLAQCRFRFFSKRTLALKPAPQRPENRLQPRITGLILHAALEDWLKEDRQRDFLAVFEEAFDRICREQHIPSGYGLEVDRIVYRAIAEHISANDLWSPDRSDVEVPLTIEFPGGIQVNGRVDRIDQFGSNCVIVDYKSKKTENVKKLVASATSLQGPLYALAVREKLNLNPVAVIFWAVRDDERFGWGAVPGSADEIYQPIPDNWAMDAKARTVERLSGFLGGQVHAHPEDSEQCIWCDYKAACRIEEQTLIGI